MTAKRQLQMSKRSQRVFCFRTGCRVFRRSSSRSASAEAAVRVQEGKFHQVRRMMAFRGLPLCYLKRVCKAGFGWETSRRAR